MTQTLYDEATKLIVLARELLDNTPTETQQETTMDQTDTTTVDVPSTTPAATAAAALSPERASELYVAGQSVIEIARAFGLTYAKTRKILAETNTPIRDASSRLKGRPRAKKTADA